MKEKDLQTLFGRKICPTVSEVYELKMTKTNRLQFSRLAPHQEKSLADTDSNKGHYYKPSDMSADRKPWDCQFLVNTPAYVVIFFYKPRKPKIGYYIRIKDFIIQRDKSKMKSITEEEAKIISEQTITL